MMHLMFVLPLLLAETSIDDRWLSSYSFSVLLKYVY